MGRWGVVLRRDISSKAEWLVSLDLRREALWGGAAGCCTGAAFGSALWVIKAYDTLPGFTWYFLATATLAAAIPLAVVLWLVFQRRGGLGTAYAAVLFAVGGFLAGFPLVIGLGTDAGPRQLLNAMVFLALAYGAGGAFMTFLSSLGVKAVSKVLSFHS